VSQYIHLHVNKLDREINVIFSLIPVIVFAVILAIFLSLIKDQKIASSPSRTEAVLGGSTSP